MKEFLSPSLRGNKERTLQDSSVSCMQTLRSPASRTMIPSFRDVSHSLIVGMVRALIRKSGTRAQHGYCVAEVY